MLAPAAAAAARGAREREGAREGQTRCALCWQSVFL